MNVTREVILDLLPLYLSGEASPATRTLVEEFLQHDPELAERVKLAGSISTIVPAAPKPELELRSLNRTRRLIAWQKWSFGLAMSCTALAASSQMTISDGHLTEFHFLIQQYPVPFAACLALGIVGWVVYFGLRRRVHIAVVRK